jgi:hypothetical protein
MKAKQVAEILGVETASVYLLRDEWGLMATRSETGRLTFLPESVFAVARLRISDIEVELKKRERALKSAIEEYNDRAD